MAYTQGAFVWYELNTNDQDAAFAFYGETIGWTRTDMPMGDGNSYGMFTSSHGPVAGVVDAQPGVPNNWASYVAVDDVAATLALAVKNGAKKLVDPTDIGMGVFASFADPQGAVLNLWKGKDPDEKDPVAHDGGMHWTELWAKDAAAIVPFYTQTFGYTVQEMEMPRGTYYVLIADGQPRGGILTSEVAEAPAMWLPYARVADADAAVERAKSAGADIKFGPDEVPGVGRFAIFADSKGAIFALIKPGNPS